MAPDWEDVRAISPPLYGRLGSSRTQGGAKAAGGAAILTDPSHAQLDFVKFFT
jgi:hypothetical protein